MLDQLQTKVADILTEEIEAQEQTEANLKNTIRDKAIEIQNEIQREAENSTVNLGTLQSYLEEDVPSLYDELKKGQQEREQTEEVI